MDRQPNPYELAGAQRACLQAVLLSFVLFLLAVVLQDRWLPLPLSLIRMVADGAIVCFAAAAAYLLARALLLYAALGASTSQLLMLLFVFPLNFIVLPAANAQASRELRRAGIRVGLFGASETAVRGVMEKPLCAKCGYSLIGNTSRRCPECGTPVARTGDKLPS